MMTTFRVEGTDHAAKQLFADNLIGVIYDEAAGAYYDDNEFKIAVLDQFDIYLDNVDQTMDEYEYGTGD